MKTDKHRQTKAEKKEGIVKVEMEKVQFKNSKGL